MIQGLNNILAIDNNTQIRYSNSAIRQKQIHNQKNG